MHAARTHARDVPELPGSRRAALNGEHQPDAPRVLHRRNIGAGADHAERAALRRAVKEIGMALKNT